VKRILVINYEFPPLGGGASPVSHRITLGLSQTDIFDIDVITMSFKNLPRYVEVNKHLRIYRVPCFRQKKETCQIIEQASFILPALRQAYKLHRQKPYHACHTHFIIPSGIISLLLNKWLSIPYIITSHGSDVPGYNPDRFTFTHKFTKPLIKTIINNSNGLFTGSEFLAHLIQAQINPNTIPQVIREGLDICAIMPQKKKPIILATGRLLKRKGFHTLITAVSHNDIGHEIQAIFFKNTQTFSY
jgi:glycosyltransferase involved in cell wall biosynthesis